MLYVMFGALLLFAFVLSFMGGYIYGKGMVHFPRKLTDEEKRKLEEETKRFKELERRVNESVQALMEVE